MDREKLTEEILGYLDGQLSADEERALAAKIRGDAEAEKLLADLMRLQGSFAAVLQERTGASGARRGAHRFRPAPARPGTGVWVLGTVAALAACLLITIAVSVPGGKKADRPIAGKSLPKIIEPEPLPIPEPPREQPRPAPKPPPPAPVTPAISPRPDPAPPPSPAPAQVEPAPKPEEPRPTPSPLPKTTVAEAPSKPAPVQIERAKGEVLVVAEGMKSPAREGQGLLPGQALQTVGSESLAVVRIPDGTQLELAGDTTVAEIAEATGTGRKVVLDSGTVVAKVAKQPAGQALVFATPHGEARVLGTTLKLSVDAQGTKLEVTEGRVRLTRKKDGASVDVGAGSYAVAAPGPRPLSRKIGTPQPGRMLLFDDFEDAAGVKARWQALEGGFPATTAGALDLDLSPRAGDSYAGGGWHLAGGLRTRQAFPLPFRVTVDVEVTHKDVALNALVVLTPGSQKGGMLKNEIAVRLRGGEYATLVEGQIVKTTESPSKPPIRERWTLELDRAELRFSVDGKEVQRHAHGLSMSEDYRLELQGAAKLEAPKGARVRFDNVKIEP